MLLISTYFSAGWFLFETKIPRARNYSFYKPWNIISQNPINNERENCSYYNISFCFDGLVFFFLFLPSLRLTPLYHERFTRWYYELRNTFSSIQFDSQYLYNICYRYATRHELNSHRYKKANIYNRFIKFFNKLCIFIGL